jgi:hypothetical protein
MRIPTMHDTPLTPRQETFVLALTRGLDISAAQREAGYASRRNATHTLSLPNVKNRLAALRAEALARNNHSVDEICARLWVIVERMKESAGSVPEFNLMRRALVDLARIQGQLVEKASVAAPVNRITEIRRVIVWPDGREEEYGK